MPFATVGDVEWFYTDEGSGPGTVLLVHGWTCDSHDWMWQIPVLSKKMRVIAVDLPGHGRSTGTPAGYGPADMADGLAALLLSLEVGPVLAMGHSLGGAVVTALAVEHPSQVSGVIAIDPAYGISPDELSAVQYLVDEVQKGGDLSLVAMTIEGFDAPSTPSHLTSWHTRRALGMSAHVCAEVLAGMYLTDRQFGTDPAARTYLAKRDCPVLAIYANQPRSEAERSVLTEERQVILWTDVGHWLHQERPDEFNALVIAWINDNIGDHRRRPQGKL
jgi:pimeloyl-ACP methyl ester carboxylesterase